MPDDEKTEIPLGEMIETLRQELQAAQSKGTGQSIRFGIDKVELEIQMVVSRKRSGDGKVAFWVLSAGGGLENRGETTQKIKLTLSPVSSDDDGKVVDGNGVLVNTKTNQPLTGG